MKHLATLLLIAFLLVSPSSATAQQPDSWVLIAEKLMNSTVRLGTGCSGFVIDTERKHVLTAAHCGAEENLVDGTPSIVLSKDADYDLLVLRVPDMEKPALKLAKEEAKTGELVASMGYGASLEEPMFRSNVVSIGRVNIESLKGQWVLFQNPFVGGQSGGPVVNQAGDIISIVQMSNATTGIGRGVKLLKDKVGRFFQR